jgi:ABC-2 type transport system permease protein
VLRAELAAAAAYRAQLGLVSWVVPLAFLALWRGAAASGPVGGITVTQFGTYFCILLVTTNLQIVMPVIFEFGHWCTAASCRHRCCGRRTPCTR